MIFASVSSKGVDETSGDSKIVLASNDKAGISIARVQVVRAKTNAY